jgi:hypothetical protein
MEKLENILVKELANKISYKYSNIHTNRKPSASSKVRNYLYRKLNYIPLLQPEIDIIIESNNNELYGIEVKLFKTDSVNFNLPFYHGLGQSVALYRYGFDRVALFQLFIGQKPPNNMNIYGPEIWAFIRNDLKIPLDYSYIWVEELSDARHNFHVMQYINRQDGIKLRKIDDPNFNITFKYKNPIKDLPVPKTIRACLELWLNNNL